MDKTTTRRHLWNWTRIILITVAVLAAIIPTHVFERSTEDIAEWWILRASGAEMVSVDVSVDSLEKREWGIVLGASIRSGHFRERVNRAAELWKAGKVEKLLLSGDGREKFYDEPAAMKALLLTMGIPEEVILLDKKGLSTFESMERASSEFGVSEAWVVTQEFHGPRAVYLAKHHGIDAGTVCAVQPVDAGADEKRERKARVKAILQAWGLADTAIKLMKKTSSSFKEIAVL